MERLKRLKETFVTTVESQLGNLQQVDTKELGEAVDMIKDLSEAIYYCSITDAMEKNEKEEKRTHHHYYTPYYLPGRDFDDYYMPDRDMDREYLGRMYYSGNQRNSNGQFAEGNSMGGRSSSYGRGGRSG